MTEQNDTTEVFYAECDSGALFGGGDDENWQRIGGFKAVDFGRLGL